MSKTRFISFIAAGLLIINIALVIFIALRKPGPRHVPPRDHIIEALHFTPEQVKKYDVLISWHQREIRKTEQEVLEMKNRMYLNLPDQSLQDQNDSLMQTLGEMQVAIEKIHYKHFEDIRDLCRNDQKKDFEKLSKEMARLFFVHRMPPKDKKP